MGSYGFLSWITGQDMVPFTNTVNIKRGADLDRNEFSSQYMQDMQYIQVNVASNLRKSIILRFKLRYYLIQHTLTKSKLFIVFSYNPDALQIKEHTVEQKQ